MGTSSLQKWEQVHVCCLSPQHVGCLGSPRTLIPKKAPAFSLEWGDGREQATAMGPGVTRTWEPWFLSLQLGRAPWKALSPAHMGRDSGRGTVTSSWDRKVGKPDGQKVNVQSQGWSLLALRASGLHSHMLTSHRSSCPGTGA